MSEVAKAEFYQYWEVLATAEADIKLKRIAHTYGLLWFDSTGGVAIPVGDYLTFSMYQLINRRSDSVVGGVQITGRTCRILRMSVKRCTMKSGLL